MIHMTFLFFLTSKHESLYDTFTSRADADELSAADECVRVSSGHVWEFFERSDDF